MWYFRFLLCAAIHKPTKTHCRFKKEEREDEDGDEEDDKVDDEDDEDDEDI